MRTHTMKAEMVSAMKARMSEAGWDEIDEIAEACVDCENGADVADVLIHHLDIGTGDVEDRCEAWNLVCEWADGDFAEPAPF